jgi:tetratricopeptide (TPR) repeat protein
MISVVHLPAFQADDSTSLGKLKSMAEAQHEIVILLVKKQEYDKAAAEANKIFDMKWPGDQEPLLLKELLNLADAFLQQGQASLGLRLIERNSKYFRKASSQASIFKEMGYLYKSLKQDDKAIEYFKKARDLEGGK